MTERTRFVFRIVDIFVATAIVAVILALLIPWLSHSRTQRRGVYCINNQRNIAIALINFERRRRQYPGWREQIGTEQSPQSVSWVFAILPELDRNDLYRAYRPGGQRFGTDPTQTLDILICPSDPPSQEGESPLSYAANAGMPDARITRLNSATWTGDLAANGIFHDLDPWFHRPADGEEKKLTTVSSGYVSDHDGLSMTILISERVEAGRWPQYGDQKTPGENITGILWQNDLPSPAGTLHPEARINGLLPPPAESFADVNHVRPSSFHPGGVVVTFADGHTRFISDQIDYLVYALMMTPNGRESRDPRGEQPVRAEFRETVFDEEMIQ